MNPRELKFLTVAAIVALGLGLAGCGGGGSSTPAASNGGGMQMPDPAETQLTAITSAIATARTAVTAVDDDATDAQVKSADNAIAAARTAIGAASAVSDDVKAGHTGTVNALASDLGNRKTSRTAAMNAKTKTMAAKLQKLATGIGAVDTDSPAVATRVDGMRKMGTKDTALAAPYAISGWTGMSWSSMSGSGASKTTTTAVVYNDKGADTPAAFNKRFASIALTGDDAGQYRVTVADHAKLIKITGLPTHASHTGLAVGSTNGVKGSLAGATGTFTANSGEISIGVSATDGSPTWTGDLDFKPDSATATVMMPDTSYSSLGWWLTEAANGDLTPEVAAWASDDYSGTLPIVGKATFMGIAVGKYTHKTINSISGGHFNADAELVAEFATATTLTGTIDNFMSDGESIGDGWKVELAAGADNAASFDATAGATITGGTATTAAAHSARGTFGTQKTMGTWTAQFVDDSRRDTMPGGVVGTFRIGETAHPINMIGAFAASNQETDLPEQ